MIGSDPALLLAAAIQLVNVRAFAHRQQAGVGVNAQLGAGVHDVQIAHGQLADAVERAERRVFHLFHAQTFWRVSEAVVR